MSTLSNPRQQMQIGRAMQMHEQANAPRPGIDRAKAIKQMIEDDEYDTPERLDAAIDTLAQDLQQHDKKP